MFLLTEFMKQRFDPIVNANGKAGGGCMAACEKDAESRFISFMDPGLTQSCYVMHEIAGAPLTRGDLGARFLQPTARSKGLTKRGRTKRAQRGQRGSWFNTGMLCHA